MTVAKPRAASNTATSNWARVRPKPGHDRPSGIASGSGAEDMAANCCDVGEDADAEDDDDAGRQLTTHAELVSEVDDQPGDEHVGDERDDEDPIVEYAVEVGP